MNDDTFFRKATLCICGTLEIEQALQSCVQLFRQVMPVDIIFLEYYDHGFGAMRTIARATADECSRLDLITPLTQAARDSAALKNVPPDKDVFLFSNPHETPISREMLDFHGIRCTSLLVLQLRTETQVLGALVLVANEEMYTQRHVDLLALLKEPFMIATANALRHREVLQLKDLLADDNRYLHEELHRISGDEIIGSHFGLREVMQHVRQVAALDSPVLLSGETGVGKDVIANAIHYSSTRSGGPFISVNCGAIPDSLIDSELFGHEKGAFTGAVAQKRGRFERAEGGTIFLDEIGELPLAAQARLLRVLQSKEIERVGGTTTISLNIRIIAATNRNLQQMVVRHEFREDLWYRLNVFPISIPPLRERRSDLPELLQYFIHRKAKELKLPAIPDIMPEALDILLSYNWPGNVRELQNLVERELILHPRGPLTFAQLRESPAQPSVPAAIPDEHGTDNLNQVLTRHIQQVLENCGGKIHGPGGAAERLGINASTLRNKMKSLGIRYRRKDR